MSEKYSYIEQDSADYTAIRIDSGTYKGIIVVFGKVGFSPEPDENELFDMTFDHQILFNPNKVEVNKQDFINVLGDILVSILEEYVEHDKPNKIFFLSKNEA